MRYKFNKAFIDGLDFNKQPVSVDDSGKLIYKDNISQKPYTIFDSGDSPGGFGIRVGKNSKSYVLMTSINNKQKTNTIGRHGDLIFNSGKDRDPVLIARTMLVRAKAGVDINEEKRQARKPVVARTVPTLGDLFDEFLAAYLANKKKPPKENTVGSIKKMKERLTITQEKIDAWDSKKMGYDLTMEDSLVDKLATEITKADLERVFNRIAEIEGHRGTAELTMTWVSTVYNRRIKEEENNDEELEPIVTRNPVTRIRSLFRTSSELRNAGKPKRNPLDNTPENLGAVLKALFNATNRNRQGAEFLLTNLLLGSRKSEPARLKWASKLTDEEIKNESWVDLDRNTVCFRDTKNRNDHTLPMGPVLSAVMHDRFKRNPGSLYVFPAGPKNPRRTKPHYTDSDGFRRTIIKESGNKFTMHDLRRTFSKITNAMNIPTITLKRLLNHLDGDVTDLYAQPNAEDLRPSMRKIEATLLKHGGFTAEQWIAGTSGDTKSNQGQ